MRYFWWGETSLVTTPVLWYTDEHGGVQQSYDSYNDIRNFLGVTNPLGGVVWSEISTRTAYLAGLPI